MKVSQMLDRLYLAFDTVARKHEVFKVETIGGACVLSLFQRRFLSCFFIVRVSYIK